MTTYSIEQLPQDAKDKAVQRLLDLDITTLTDCWSGLYQDLHESLNYLGMTNIDMEFYNMGNPNDAFVFTADYDSALVEMDYLKSLKGDFYLTIKDKVGLIHDFVGLPEDARVQVKMKRDDSIDAQYIDFCTKDSYDSITIEGDIDPKELDALKEKVFDWLNAVHKVISDFALTDYYNDYNHYTSEDGVVEYAQANGYEFDIDGNMV